MSRGSLIPTSSSSPVAFFPSEYHTYSPSDPPTTLSAAHDNSLAALDGDGFNPPTSSRIGAGTITGIVLASIASFVLFRVSIHWAKLLKLHKKEKKVDKADSKGITWGGRSLEDGVQVIGETKRQRGASTVEEHDEPRASTVMSVEARAVLVSGNPSRRSHVPSIEEVERDGVALLERNFEVDALEQESALQSNEQQEQYIQDQDQIPQHPPPAEDEVLRVSTLCDSALPVQSEPPAMETRSISDRSMATVLSDPPPPYSTDDPFNIEELDCTNVTSRRSISESK